MSSGTASCTVTIAGLTNEPGQAGTCPSAPFTNLAASVTTTNATNTSVNQCLPVTSTIPNAAKTFGAATIADGATRRQLSSRLHVAPEPGRILQPITFLPQGRSSGGAFRVEAVGSRAYIISVDPLTGRVSTRRADS